MLPTNLIECNKTFFFLHFPVLNDSRVLCIFPFQSTLFETIIENILILWGIVSLLRLFFYVMYALHSSIYLSRERTELKIIPTF